MGSREGHFFCLTVLRARTAGETAPTRSGKKSVSLTVSPLAIFWIITAAVIMQAIKKVWSFLNLLRNILISLTYRKTL